MDAKNKILLAEDDYAISRVYAGGLTHAGFEVSVAVNGIEALEKIRIDQPDLVLLDLMMPIKNGFEVLEEIRKDDALKDIPVIILSNLGQESDIARSKELGITDYLVKSDTSMKHLIEKVKSHFNQ